jgi:CheY-like chemotaxis protein
MASQTPLRPIVLVVEDETLVRFDAIQSLEDEGFDVVDAYDADQALLILSERADIAAIFTDVHMPGATNGLQLAHVARASHPGLAIVVTSGVLQVQDDDLPQGARFTPKPYDATNVARLVRALIAQAA